MSLVNELRAEIQSLRSDLAALEERLEKLDEVASALTTHSQAVDGLVQRLLERVQAMEDHEAPYWEVVRELMKQLGSVERDLAVHRHGMSDDHFTGGPIQPYGEVYEYTPPQPTAAEGDKGMDVYASVWSAAQQSWSRDQTGSDRWSAINAGQAAVDKAIELGLAARPISADDEGLQWIIENHLPDARPVDDDLPRRILASLAAALQEVRDASN